MNVKSDKTQFDRELISAHCDGQLNDSERVEVEDLLATNILAADYFRQLNANRLSMSSLAGGSLGSSFADRIILLAQAAAKAQGLAHDHPILRSSAVSEALDTTPPGAIDLGSVAQSDISFAQDAAVTTATATDRDYVRSNTESAKSWLPRSNRVLWSGLMAAAAALVCFAVVPNFLDGPQLVDDVHGPNLISKMLPEDILPDGLVSDAPADAQLLEGGLSPFDSVASASEAVDVSANVMDVNSEARPPSGVARVTGGIGATDALRMDLEPDAVMFDYLMTVDVVMSEEAWRDGYFDLLLAKVAIPPGNPITADLELSQLLDDSRVAVGSVDRSDPIDSDRAALVFVRAKGSAVDRLLVELSRDREHFPKLAYDLSIDPQRVLLRKLLSQHTASTSNGQSRELGASVVQRSASVLVSQPLTPSFIPARAPDYRDSADAGNLSLNALDGLSNNDPIAEVLFVLRDVP